MNRKPLDWIAISLMVVLCSIWGLQQVAIKAVAADVAPILQMAIRSGVASGMVWIYSKCILKERWEPGLAWKSGLLAGSLFSLEFLFVAEGLRWTTAGHMSVLLYTAPIFAALGLHLRLTEEKLTVPQWVGIGCAFTGILAVFLGRPASVPTHWLWGDLLGLAAGAAWGFTTVVVRISRLSDAPPAQVLFYQLFAAFCFLTPISIFTREAHFLLSGRAMLSLAFQALVVSFASYLTWFWLLRHYLASRLGVLSFLTPIFGLLAGSLLLREPLDAGFQRGSALVLAGLLITSMLRSRQQ